MPELPEVETVKNILLPVVKNRKIISIDTFPGNIISIKHSDFKLYLTNETFKDITRIGKYLIFHLSNNKVLVSHLRMEGKYYLFNKNEPNSKYVKVVFHLDDGNKLNYDDSRGFGTMILSNETEYKSLPEISKLGPEPFYITDVTNIVNECKTRSTAIKSVILEQTLITGLGNIYVDETLYKCHIHPHTPAKFITKNDWENIINNSSIIMNKAIKNGGSTIRSYHPGNGIDGKFQNELKIYGKSGQICPVCGKEFLFTKTNGRGTTFCPGCQHKLGSSVTVALTGKIASGKTKVNKFLKEQGCFTISSDEIVSNLYQKEKISRTIEQMFKISFPSAIVDKTVLRNYLLTHPIDKKKLERYIWPMVEQEINNLLSHSKNDINVVEIPLLFDAHMEADFDTVIVVTSNDEDIDSRLLKRNGNNGQLLKEINKTNSIDKNIKKAEFIINNNSTLENLQKEVDSILIKLKSRLR